MKKIIRLLLVLAITLNVAYSLSLSLNDHYPTVSNTFKNQDYSIAGGEKALSIAACTGGYGICMGYAESWWERLICDSAFRKQCI